jgi:hypothetical protein
MTTGNNEDNMIIKKDQGGKQHDYSRDMMIATRQHDDTRDNMMTPGTTRTTT